MTTTLTTTTLLATTQRTDHSIVELFIATKRNEHTKTQYRHSIAVLLGEMGKPLQAIIALSVIGESRGWEQETELLSQMQEHRDKFPHIPIQSRFNRRRRNLMWVRNVIRRLLLRQLDVAQERQCVIDSLPRRNQKQQLPAQVRREINAVRQMIETVNGQLTAQFNIETNHAHTFWGLCTRLYAKLTAHTLCIYINRLLGKPDFLQIKALAFPISHKTLLVLSYQFNCATMGASTTRLDCTTSLLKMH